MHQFVHFSLTASKTVVCCVLYSFPYCPWSRPKRQILYTTLLCIWIRGAYTWHSLMYSSPFVRNLLRLLVQCWLSCGSRAVRTDLNGRPSLQVTERLVTAVHDGRLPAHHNHWPTTTSIVQRCQRKTFLEPAQVCAIDPSLLLVHLCGTIYQFICGILN